MIEALVNMPEFVDKGREGREGAEMGCTDQTGGTRMGHSSFRRGHQRNHVNRAKIGAETKGETRESLIQMVLKKRVIVGGDHIGMIGPLRTSDLIPSIMVARGKISVYLFGIL
jgi:hypothetical protein